jgi:diguanylate cyclase (GGDEF)-like protein
MKEKPLLASKFRNILTFVIVICLMASGEYLFIRYLEEQKLNDLKISETKTILQASTGLSDWVTQEMELIAFLSNDARVVSFIETPSDINRLEVKQLFGNISYATALFDQIRILDMEGMEVVRVDYEDEYKSPVVIPDKDLQDKSNRNYFPICRDLPKGGIYISRIDLNVENKQVEVPYKPVVRVCSPLTATDGLKKGILILNFNATEMLESFSSLSQNLMLVNDDGYWIVSPNPQDEWAFMFGRDESFINRYPQEWETISSTESDQLIDHIGLWTYSTIYPLNDVLKQNSHIWNESYIENTMMQEIPQYFWKIISFIPERDLREMRKKNATPIILTSLVFYPLALLGIWGINQRREIKKQETERIRFLATHDGMTGLFNKAFLEAEIKRLNFGRAYPVSIVMIDANNLKKINDSLGHQEGDNLIRNISELIKLTFRKDDILARVGGDEFALVLLVTNSKDCMAILNRFRENIEEFNRKGVLHQVDIAIGFATTQENEDLNSVLKRADEAMYQEKKRQKKERSTILRV